MKYEVRMSKVAIKGIGKLPKPEKITLLELIEDIRESGPVQPKYKNYSRLSKDTYHCHLSYRWVACWQCRNGQYVVEVYYVGSRESAPY